jgi:hypothetical protein
VRFDDPVTDLFHRLDATVAQLEALLDRANALQGREPVLAEVTCRMIASLRGLAPGRPFCKIFADTADRWAEGTDHARSHLLTNAFLQARFFLQLAVYCARSREHPLPDGRCASETAALLRLYQFQM